MTIAARRRGTRRVGARAVVTGASIAGLCCARLLSERFDEVIVVDRDELPDRVQWRRQVPQGRHQHVLLPTGARLLDTWFPGIVDELHGGGAVDLDLSQDFYRHENGAPWRRFPSNLHSPSMSRPFLEQTIRARVEAIANVTIQDCTAVVGLEVDDAQERISGVQLDDGTIVASDLTVDASGRRAITLGWLQELGYEPPPTSTVEVGIRYVTQVYERSDRPERDWKATFVIGPPASRRIAAAIPFEGDRWFVLLGGVNGEFAPTDPVGALEYARSLPSPAVAEVIEASEPIGEPVIHRFPANQRRHVERLGRFPLGWAPVGDAVCSFNPLYGQGMTVAAQQAQVMADHLDREGAVTERFARRYLRALGRIVDDPWQIALSNDFAYDDTEGRRPPGTDLLNRYMNRLSAAAQHDDVVALRLWEVATLQRRPRSLLSPGSALRALRSGRPRSAGVSWSWRDSNPRPPRCDRGALAN